LGVKTRRGLQADQLRRQTELPEIIGQSTRRPLGGAEKKMIENKKKPNPIDIHVGSRVRLRRNMLGMSQEKLGESLGITFQQIQKYEKGTNRVGASRLQAISTVLNVPVSFFFEDAPGVTPSGLAEGGSTSFVVDFLNSAEGLQLNRAFAKINDAKVRRKIIDLVKALVDTPED
jgi:transcriptional regulator with XRE-family HTH domain